MNRKKFLKTGLLTTAALASFPAIASGKKEHRKRNSVDPKIMRADEGKKVNVIGDQQTFKLTGEDTDGQFTLIEEVNPPVSKRPATSNPIVKNTEIEAARREYLRNQATKPLDNPQIISEMENVPAYKRRKVSLEDAKDGRKDGVSGYKVSVDDDAPIISSNNSFLHDNID